MKTSIALAIASVLSVSAFSATAAISGFGVNVGYAVTSGFSIGADLIFGEIQDQSYQTANIKLGYKF